MQPVCLVCVACSTLLYLLFMLLCVVYLFNPPSRDLLYCCICVFVVLCCICCTWDRCCIVMYLLFMFVCFVYLFAPRRAVGAGPGRGVSTRAGVDVKRVLDITNTVARSAQVRAHSRNMGVLTKYPMPCRHMPLLM